MMNEEELEELSPAKKLACNLIAAFVILAAGLFLLLCGVGVIPLKVSRAVCGTLLFAVSIMFLASALICRNSVSLWLGCCFLVPAVVEVLVKTTSAGYAQLYPLYIAIPAVASLVTMVYTRAFISHLPVVLLFGVPAAIFALKSGGVVGWAVVVPVLVIYAGVLMLALALKKRRENDDEA